MRWFAIWLAATCTVAPIQEDPVPHKLALPPEHVLTYTVCDLRRDPKTPVGQFTLFASEVRSSGFERFSRGRIDELPREFLLRHPPSGIQPGKAWDIDTTIGETSLDVFSLADRRSLRFRGSLRLESKRRNGLWIMCGRLEIIESVFHRIEDPIRITKEKRLYEGVGTPRPIGSLELECSLRPGTGVLQEATYRYAIKIGDPEFHSAPGSEAVTVLPAGKGYDFFHRVALASEPGSASKLEIAQIAAEAARRGIQWLPSQIKGPKSKGQFRGIQDEHCFPHVAAAVQAACAQGTRDPVVEAFRAELRSPAHWGGYNSLHINLAALCAIYLPITPDRPLCSFSWKELASLDRRRMKEDDVKTIGAMVDRLLAIRDQETGMWSCEGKTTAPQMISLELTAEVAWGLHFAARLGWTVDPAIWKDVVRGLRRTALERPLPADRRVITFREGSLYTGLMDGPSAVRFVWPALPLHSSWLSVCPGGGSNLSGALVILALARAELSHAGALDPGTEKTLTELQRGALASLGVTFTSRRTLVHSPIGDQAREYGPYVVPLVELYGIEKIGEHSPYEEFVLAAAAAQNSDGGWSIPGDTDKRSAILETANVIRGLAKFSTRADVKP